MRAALVLGVLASLLALPAATGKAGGPGRPALVRFAVASGRILVTTPRYRLILSAENGALLSLIDRRARIALLRGQNGCMWGAVATDLTTVSGCGYRPSGPSRFAFSWRQETSTLVLRYLPDPDADRRLRATVELRAGLSQVDLRLVLDNDWGRPLSSVLLPADLLAPVAAAKAGYAPNFLPGVRFRPSFFSRVGDNVLTYPGRWAFADYLALDLGQSHLALYSVSPAPAPIAPVDLGFIHNQEPVPCSGPLFCLTHVFQTWIGDGASWSSPLVRLRIGESASESILAYRRENGIDRYPSLAEKVGDRLSVLARAPLVKADPWKGLPAFREWPSQLGRLPSPSLLHPVAFQPGGHDESYPDFLPPDPRWGTQEELARVVSSAHALGQLVMPYLNVSWWDEQAPSLRSLSPPLEPADVAMRTSSGEVVREQFGSHDGLVVSPWALPVRRRVEALMEEWQRDVPVDCLFFDQIGARPWRRDFNPAAPTPLAYADGWLSLLAPYRDRCLMVEDGWDRLAESAAGFHGGILLMQRELSWPDRHWGVGTWEPYPLALWLLHDKVLLYQHDLYEGTMTEDPQALAFNLAFGLVLSGRWQPGTGSDSWLALSGRLQRLLGPYYAGRPFLSYRFLAPSVTKSEFSGGYTVVVNWSEQEPYDLDGYRIAPLGFLARADGRFLAGALGNTWREVVVEDGSR